MTYDIQKLDYQGLPVYRQIGDMSAGFGVLKTIVAFDQGIAATMEEAPQGGTYPVVPTPEFLIHRTRHSYLLSDDKQEVPDNLTFEYRKSTATAR